MRARAIVVVLAACGGDAQVTQVPGAPKAIRAIGFDGDGRVVVIGGASAFGLAQLQVQADGAWQPVVGVGGFDARAQLLGGRDRPLSAISQATTLYRATADATAPWSRATIPPGATPGTTFGVDGAGHVYGLDLTEGDGDGAVLRWLPGMARWDEVAGTRPLGIAARGYTVDVDGRVAWIIPGIGVVTAVDGVRTTRFPCADCGLTEVTHDATGTLTALACPVVVRLSDDGATDEPAVPASSITCDALTTAPDGTSVLATYDETATGTLWRLPPRATAWERITEARSERTYVVRDAATAYAYGDGLTVDGLDQIEF